MKELIAKYPASDEIRQIANKVIEGERITPTEGILLYKDADTGLLAALANFIRQKKSGDKVYFNRNFHLEPTNICIYGCHFCAYSRREGQEGSWEYSIDEMIDIVRSHKAQKATEIHIVGGVHPKRDLWFYCELLKRIKQEDPDLQIKGFTAVELAYMIKKADLSLRDGLEELKKAGLISIPGGGAEIFAPEIRKRLCNDKATGELWLEVHRTAHEAGIPSNATMLYGHVETYEHRIDHLNQLRDLQDITNGFNTFIPLKYRKANNALSEAGEVGIVEDMRNYAVSRIYLDNIPHLKAYWPALGKQNAKLSLAYGVDDLDGTIDDSTKIYTMAGVDEKASLSSNDIIQLIHDEGYTAVERDTNYNELHVWPSTKEQ
jgi:aminodeoxyfutalosine synthase